MESSRSLIARTASAHHRPDAENLSEQAVMIADRLSSGADRITDEEEESKRGFRESRLVSVFDEIEVVKHQFKPPGNSFHALVPLETGSEKVFPISGNPAGPPEDYEKLFPQFLSELKTLETGLAFPFYLEGLISLLEKYTWCIPSSSYKTLPDVSLFDHSLSTAGIAQALFLYHSASESIPKWEDREIKFILLGGDLSGIQDYIFGISRSSGRGVSKIFRARSFYLQAITQCVLLDIQKRLGLYSVCRLMDSGGKFIVLLPNSSEVLNNLEELDEEVQVWFRKKFKGTLTMNLSWSTQVHQEDFRLKAFQTKIDEVIESLEAAKFQKLHRTFALDGTVIKEDYGETEGGNCSLCGINSADVQSSRAYQQEEGPSVPVCSSCSEQILYIGKRLPSTVYLLFGEKGDVPLLGQMRLTLSDKIPSNLDGVLHVDSLKDTGNFRRARLARYLPLMTAQELSDERWRAVFQQELDEGEPGEDEPKTFGMIAQKSKKE